MPLLLLSAKRHARLPCSVVNVLATVRCRYQLFASYEGSSPSSETEKNLFHVPFTVKSAI